MITQHSPSRLAGSTLKDKELIDFATGKLFLARLLGAIGPFDHNTVEM
jgi:hypothetical protein